AGPRLLQFRGRGRRIAGSHSHPVRTPGGRAMRIQCPQCQSTIEVPADQVREVLCPSCGSSIQLDPNATAGWLPEAAPKRLGRFEFLERLGVGAFGTVYKARDTELDRVVAVKVPRAGSVTSQDDLDRFVRE